MPAAAVKQNRLSLEKSPYLLQHAGNPVDWYPWGDEAFEKAKAEDKPVFLSIGYSACHWCHVMERESFRNEEAASLLNKSFVPVKVDREERPDVDMVYMNVCQAMTGSGGWPLTVLLTPEKKPFFAGTYLPPRSMYGRTGLVELLENISLLWNTHRKELIEQGEKVAGHMSVSKEKTGSADTGKALENGFLSLEALFDSERGGFSYIPKFPMPHYLLFLLRDHKLYGRTRSLNMVKKSLEYMYRGGIFDHVGGGFSRYSTDEKWLVPHFEKMLYDNALLLKAYAKGFAATGNEMFRHVADKTAAYLIRDMQSPEGGFYSAEDADSEGGEGLFYIWQYDELKEAVNKNELSLLEDRYGLNKKGNFEGGTILNRTETQGFADRADEEVLAKLYLHRKNRVPPFKDTKISAAWNGLAIEAMVNAGMFLNVTEYIICANKAADFVLDKMTDKKGTVSCGTYIDGAAGPAFLADYANMINALAALFIARRDLRYLEQALLLAEKMLLLFEDEHGFYMSARDELFVRPRDEHDGATPSGSSCAVMALVALWQITGVERWRKAADKAIAAMLPGAAESAAEHIHFLSVLMLRTAPHRQIIIAARGDNAEALAAYNTLCKRFEPFTTVIWHDISKETEKFIPHIAHYKKDAPFAGYICENFMCKQPVYSAVELLNMV
ncbi:MAG: thioredoxin domain-containing protein [Christensenellales bacterium]